MDRVVTGRRRVTKRLDAGRIVQAENGLHQMRERMVVEIRGDVAHMQGRLRRSWWFVHGRRQPGSAQGGAGGPQAIALRNLADLHRRQWAGEGVKGQNGGSAGDGQCCRQLRSGILSGGHRPSSDVLVLEELPSQSFRCTLNQPHHPGTLPIIAGPGLDGMPNGR